MRVNESLQQPSVTHLLSITQASRTFWVKLAPFAHGQHQQPEQQEEEGSEEGIDPAAEGWVEQPIVAEGEVSKQVLGKRSAEEAGGEQQPAGEGNGAQQHQEDNDEPPAKRVAVGEEGA